MDSPRPSLFSLPQDDAPPKEASSSSTSSSLTITCGRHPLKETAPAPFPRPTHTQMPSQHAPVRVAQERSRRHGAPRAQPAKAPASRQALSIPPKLASTSSPGGQPSGDLEVNGTRRRSKLLCRNHCHRPPPQVCFSRRVTDRQQSFCGTQGFSPRTQPELPFLQGGEDAGSAEAAAQFSETGTPR